MGKKENFIDQLYELGWLAASIIVGAMVFGFLFCCAWIIVTIFDAACMLLVNIGGRPVEAGFAAINSGLTMLAYLIVGLFLLAICAAVGHGRIEPIYLRWKAKRGNR